MPNPSNPGFVNLQSYLSANSGAVGNTANKLAAKDGIYASAAQTEGNNVASGVYDQAKAQGVTRPFEASQTDGYQNASDNAQQASQALSGLTDFGGSASQLQDMYGGNAGQYMGGARGGGGQTAPSNRYSHGDTAFDANLLGGSADAQKTFTDTQKQFGGLDTYLADHSQQAIDAGNAAHVEPGPRTVRDPGDPTGLIPPTRQTDGNDPIARPRPSGGVDSWAGQGGGRVQPATYTPRHGVTSNGRGSF